MTREITRGAHESSRSQRQDGQSQRNDKEEHNNEQPDSGARPTVQLPRDARTRHNWGEGAAASSTGRSVPPGDIPQFDLGASQARRSQKANEGASVSSYVYNRRAPRISSADIPAHGGSSASVRPVQDNRPQPTFSAIGAIDVQHLAPDGGLTVQVNRLRGVPCRQPQVGAPQGTLRHIRATESRDPNLREALDRSRSEFDNDDQRRASEEATLRQTLQDSLRSGQRDMLRWFDMDEESLAQNFYRRRTRWECGHEVDNGFTEQRRQQGDYGVLFQDEPGDCPECAAAGLGLPRSASRSTATQSTRRTTSIPGGVIITPPTAERNPRTNATQSSVAPGSSQNNLHPSTSRQSHSNKESSRLNVPSQSQSSRQSHRQSHTPSQREPPAILRPLPHAAHSLSSTAHGTNNARTATQAPHRVPTRNLPNWGDLPFRTGSSIASNANTNNNAGTSRGTLSNLEALDWVQRAANHPRGTTSTSSSTSRAGSRSNATWASNTQAGAQPSCLAQGTSPMYVDRSGGASLATAGQSSSRQSTSRQSTSRHSTARQGTRQTPATATAAAGTSRAGGTTTSRAPTMPAIAEEPGAADGDGGQASGPTNGPAGGRTAAVDWEEVRRMRLGRFGGAGGAGGGGAAGGDAGGA